MKKNKLDFIEKMNQKPDTKTDIVLGENVRIDPTAILGEPGHTLAKDADGAWQRAKHHGGIKIKDDVHIGEFTVVKRATLENHYTVIGEDTKICSYVNVGHNCQIGEHVFIGPHACLNGSVKVGNNAWIAAHAVIGQHAVIGEDAVIGMGAVVPPRAIIPQGKTYVGTPAQPIEYNGNIVASDFQHGVNLELGKFCHIHPGVIVGDNCRIRSYVELRKNTVIGDDCYIDSGVKTSGDCIIGDRVTLRYDSIIARGVIIEDDVFIAPQVMTENLNSKKETIGGAHIESNCFIGVNVTLAAGIRICKDTIIGSKANVRKDITEPGVYIGNPARKIK